jgi:GNAT superfamily N-acetyltransferase
MEKEPFLENIVSKIEISDSGSVFDIHGDEIGFVETSQTDEHLMIENIQLKEQYQNKGYGKSIYVTLIKRASAEGKTLHSGEELSRQALKVWEWLVKNNLATKSVEGFRDETKQNIGYTNEQYQSLL